MPPMPPTVCQKATGGPPGTSRRLRTVARGPTPTGLSPSLRPSTPNSASSRQARKRRCSWCAVPQTQRSCLLAAKRYRNAEHRMFQRDSQYLEGRKVRASRDNRAMANRTAAGRAMIATQWAEAEFAALSQLSRAGLPVPYPVQVLGTELLLEFIGDPDGTPAPRLAETRPDPASLRALWDQLVPPLRRLARLGFAHGDLSAFNLLVHRGRLLMIDMPQVVDIIAN